MRLARSVLMAALGALASCPPPARAELAAGRRAPELHVLAAWGGPTPRLGDFLGRLVLLEFLRTDCPHSQAAAPHLNALQSARSDRGLRVIGLSFEKDERIEAFRRDFHVAYPVARVETEVFRDYEVQGLPRAFLVSPEGRVLWSGKPGQLSPAEIDRWTLQAPPWPELPPELEPAAAMLRAGRLAEGRAALEVCAASKGCSAEQSVPARALLAWTERYVRLLGESAVADLERADPYEAWRAHDLLARGFRDSPPGPAEAKERALLETDPGKRREIEAGRALEAARAAWREKGRAAGQAALDAVAQAHAGTSAGASAKAIAERLRRST